MSVHDGEVSCMLVEVMDEVCCTWWKIQALQESPQGQLDYVGWLFCWGCGCGVPGRGGG